MERTIPYRNEGLTVSVPEGHKTASGELWNRLQGMSQSRIARSVAWSVIGSGFSQGGSFLSSVLLARVLGRESFGQFSLIQSTVAAFTSLASLGLGLAATKYISEYRASQPEKIGRLLGFSSILVMLAGLCFSIGLGIFAPKLAVQANRPVMILGLRLSAPYIFFLTITGYQLGILAGFEAFRSISQIGIVCGLAAPLLSWFGAAGFGMPGAVVAQDVGALLLWLLYEIAVRREYSKSGVTLQLRGVWEQRSILTRVSIPATACGAICSLAIWGSNILLARACGYGELALFTAIGNLRSAVIFLPSLIFRVAAPRLNYMFAARDLPGYRRAFWSAAGVNSSLALTGAAMAFLLGHQFLRLFGREFVGSDWLLAILLISVVIEIAVNNLSQTVFAGGRYWWSLSVMCLWTAVLLVTSAVATPRFGATGLATANLAAWLLAACFYLSEARKQTRIEEL